MLLIRDAPFLNFTVAIITYIILKVFIRQAYCVLHFSDVISAVQRSPQIVVIVFDLVLRLCLSILLAVFSESFLLMFFTGTF